ncbi:hypothetical protein JANAI62_34270 [Jannaschia pagri]|uniref:Uncharacterized protein n=1 Tax=Jannaschia pagri TaxID=2829797 RepID=A0ABQ4NQW6_9RHOB|nr:hypothetical protein JANAI61_34270 [Jannaschia sp. AI_61]GIT96804.1 hypothetical protein JANAI62_34270 [Jannaschia sp. AI_62]
MQEAVLDTQHSFEAGFRIVGLQRGVADRRGRGWVQPCIRSFAGRDLGPLGAWSGSAFGGNQPVEGKAQVSAEQERGPSAFRQKR